MNEPMHVINNKNFAANYNALNFKNTFLLITTTQLKPSSLTSHHPHIHITPSLYRDANPRE